METPEAPFSSRFELIRRVGSGGMGVVYQVLDHDRDAVVALKTLVHMEPVALDRFKREFRSLAALSHPNLVTLYELFGDKGIWFFTMEYVEGSGLLDFVRSLSDPEVYNQDGPTLPIDDNDAPSRSQADRHLGGAVLEAAASVYRWERLRSVTRQVVNGLRAIHDAGKLHRDIKPANILVEPAGRVVILDFGLVYDLEPESRGCESSVVGTVPFMSPEQIAGLELSPASDWYSLGVTLYLQLTGRLPFRGTKQQILHAKLHDDPPVPSTLAPTVPLDLDSLCQWLLHPNPAARPTADEILALLGTAEREPLATRRQDRRAEVFVGRERELSRLHAALGASVGGARVVVLEGQSGVGKSALLAQFAREARAQNSVHFGGRCYEQEWVPYKALDSAVDAIGHYLKAMPAEDVKALVPQNAWALGQLFPVLANVPGFERQGVHIDAVEQRRLAFAALRDLLLRITSRRKVVLMLDDLQWGDTDSLVLLDSLLDPGGPRLLLILAYRSELAARSRFVTDLNQLLGKLPVATERIRLDPLTAGESRLLAAQWAPRGADDEFLQFLAIESGGNPFFLRELAFHGGDAQGDRQHLRAPVLDELIWTRVVSLPPGTRDLLEVIAISGKPVPQPDACLAAGLKGRDPKTLTLLRNLNLVGTSGSGMEDLIDTYHDRVRETILSRMDTDVARTRHGQLASVLEESGRGDAEALAKHFEAARDTGKAAVYYRRAAEQATATLAFDRAAQHYERLLAVVPHSKDSQFELRHLLADALANAGRGLRAAQVFQELALSAPAPLASQLERKATFHFSASGYLEEARETAGRIMRRMGGRYPRSRTEALWLIAAGRLRAYLRGVDFVPRDEGLVAPELLDRIDATSDLAEGIGLVDLIGGGALGTRALRLALDAGEPRRLTRALATFTSQLASDGGSRAFTLCRGLITTLEELAAGSSDPRMTGYVEMAKGFVALNQGLYGAQYGHFHSAEQCFAKVAGTAWNVATCRTCLLYTTGNVGRVREHMDESRRTMREAQDRGNLFLETNTGTFALPLTLLFEDRAKEAIDLTRQSLSRWQVRGINLQDAMAGWAISWAQLYSGNAEAAWRESRTAWKVLCSGHLNRMNNLRVFYTEFRGRAALAMAALERSRGRKADSFLRSAAQARAALAAERFHYARAFADGLSAGIAYLQGDLDTAVTRLRSAAAGLDREGVTTVALCLRFQLGELTGGDEGAGLRQAVSTWAASQGILNLPALVRMHSPIFEEQG
jgi:tRNA A-37 threonylcarbamoyl transferase component Bud32